MRNLLLSFFFVISTSYLSAQENDYKDAILDSLINLMNHLKDDRLRLEYLDTIAMEHYNVDSTMKYAQMQLKLATDIKVPRQRLRALRYISWAYYYGNQYEKCISYATDALAIADSLNDKKEAGKCYNDMGNAYSMMLKVTKANECYIKALDSYTQINDSNNVTNLLRNMGETDVYFELFEEARQCFMKAQVIDSIRGKTSYIAENKSGIGYATLCEYEKYMYVKPNDTLLITAKKFFIESLDISHETNHLSNIYITNLRLVNVLLYQLANDKNASQLRITEVLDSCKTLLNEYNDIINALGYEHDSFDLVLAYAQCHIANKEFPRAKHLIDSVYNIITTPNTGIAFDMTDIYHNYISYYRAVGEYDKAFDYYALYNNANKLTNNMNDALDAAQALAQSDFNQKIRQREMEEQRRQTTFNIIEISSLIIFILLIYIVMVTVINYRRREKMNVQLASTNQLITKANQELTDSINYASVIQNAAMPSESKLEQIFGPTLVIYKPLHIVSGDFHWVTQIGRYKVIALGDCTGHGVPGAFLSMLGMSILEYIVPITLQESATASQILNDMRAIFMKSLNQNYNDESTNHDGIDMGIAVIDTKHNVLNFAGAFRPMVIVRDGETIVVHGDRMPIGSHVNDQPPFNNKTISLQTGDAIYMFSDGLTDQFGYETDGKIRKFSMSRLEKMLKEIAHLPFDQQEAAIHNKMHKWRSGTTDVEYEQTDDALIVGFKI